MKYLATRISFPKLALMKISYEPEFEQKKENMYIYKFYEKIVKADIED